jgi:hypothetical protein
MNRLAKTKEREQFFLRVPMNIIMVKNPHMKKYHARNPFSVTPAYELLPKNVILGKSHKATRDIQNNP